MGWQRKIAVAVIAMTILLPFATQAKSKAAPAPAASVTPEPEDPLCFTIPDELPGQPIQGTDNLFYSEVKKGIVDRSGNVIYQLREGGCDSTAVSPDEKYFFNGCTYQVIDLGTKKVVLKSSTVIFTNDSRAVVGQSDEDYILLNLKNSKKEIVPKRLYKSLGRKLLIKLDPKDQSGTFSENGQFRFYLDEKTKKYFRTNLKTGKSEIVKAQNLGSMHVSNQGNIVTSDYYTGYTVQDINGKKINTVKLSGNETTGDGLNYLYIYGANKYYSLYSSLKVCAKKLPVDCSNCNGPNKNLDSLIDVRDKVSCDLPLTDTAWDSTKKERPNLTDKDLIKYLQRFQKPSGFNLQDHYSILYTAGVMAEKKTDIAKEYYKALAVLELNEPKVLGKIKSNLKYDPKYKKEIFPADNKEKEFCLSSNEKAVIMPSVASYLERSGSSGNYWLKMQDLLERIYPLESILPKETQTRYYDMMESALVDNSSLSSAGLFRSTLVHLVDSNLDYEFGIAPRKTLTDVQFVRSGQNGYIYILSNDKFEEKTDSNNLYSYNQRVDDRTGLSYSQMRAKKLLTELKPGEILIDEKIEYQLGQKKMSAKLKVSATEAGLSNLVNLAPTIDYKRMWTKSKKAGAVVFGTNLGSSRIEQVKNQYLSYYTNEGFTFQPVSSVDDGKKFLLDKISSGEVSYFVKEAHSNGDARNVVDVSTKSKVLRGVKKIPGSKKEEVVYLLIPDGGSTQTFSSQDLGEVVKAHDKSTKGAPLVYLNTSCSSLYKVGPEVEAAGSGHFIDIGANSSVRFFSDDEEKSGIYSVLDGIRYEERFSEIREKLKKTEDYQTGHSRFVFPDEDDFKSKVLTTIKVPVNQSIEMTEDGAPYSINQAIERQ